VKKLCRYGGVTHSENENHNYEQDPMDDYMENDTGVNTQNVNCPGGVDYEKLLVSFGCNRISEDLKQRFKDITGESKLHLLLDRDIFYAHKDLELLLNEYQEGNPFYLYTGRGPSSKNMHIGHLIPFRFTNYLQKVFNVPVVIQMTDDEEFLHKGLSMQEIRENLISNCKDIIACGFDKSKTFIFSNLDYMGTLYPNVVRIERQINNSQIRGLFGIKPSDNIGKTAFPARQAAPSFYSSFPIIFQNDSHKNRRCLVPMGIDQDPYFRMVRLITKKLGKQYKKPALIHSKFLPSTQGKDKKMSSSDPSSAIFLHYTEKQIRKVISKSFSGGQDNEPLQREKGANINVDIPYTYLQYFLEDKEELNNLGLEYQAGHLLSGDIKDKCTSILTQVVQEHKEIRSKITDEDVFDFMKVRPLSIQ